MNVLREVKPERPEFSVLAGFEDLILPPSSPAATGPYAAWPTLPQSSS